MSNDNTKRRRANKKPAKPAPLSYVDELTALKVDDPDLDRFAEYLGCEFEGDTEPTVVLVGLLQRIKAVAAARKLGGSVDVEDVIAGFTDRLFIKCMAGEKASHRFAEQASEKAQTLINALA
jgi:hypothetical protein